jgi:DNA-binding NtrC family response regulator
LHYPYPGNVRELRNIIEYAASFCSTDEIGMEHLPAYLFEEKGDVEETVSESREGLRAEPNHRTPAAGLSWAAIERKLIVDTLLKVGGHKGRAAEILGWGRTTLWRKMKQYGLEE